MEQFLSAIRAIRTAIEIAETSLIRMWKNVESSDADDANTISPATEVQVPAPASYITSAHEDDSEYPCNTCGGPDYGCRLSCIAWQRYLDERTQPRGN